MSAGELVREAFALFERDTVTLLDTVDKLFIAALQCRELELTPTESNQVNVTVDGSESFEVRLPHDRRSIFRTMLARVGAICGYAEGTMEGNGEMERKEIEYVKAITRPKPGAPLYLVDADLTVRTVQGEQSLRVKMSNNNAHPLFLKISACHQIENQTHAS